jgi:large subunit ribosomal protein L25
MATNLKAQLRSELGSGNAYKLRNQSILPAVLYGKGIENKNLKVAALEVERILRTKSGRNTFINLQVEGDKEYPVLIKSYQANVITRDLTHIDFWRVDENQEVEVDIETKLYGKAPGLLQGGILEHINHSVKLTCKANSIPQELSVDISKLEINHNIHLLDIQLPEGAKIREGYNPTIVSMVEEKAQVEETPVAEAAAEGETAEAPAEGGEKPAQDGDAKADGEEGGKS